MDRKSLIYCLILLAVLVLGTGIAVAFLYSGTSSDADRDKAQVADQSRYALLPVVPSDALAVACLSKSDHYGYKCRSVVSMHYSGELVPLYAYEVSDSEDAASMADSLKAHGLLSESVSGRPIVVASKSEAILKSSLRHLDRGVSIMDAPGFAEASVSVSGNDVLFLSNSHAGNLMSAYLLRKFSSRSGFISRVADWTVFDVRKSADRLALTGTAVYEGDLSEFMTVLASSDPATSSVSSVLPSYVRFAASLPLGKVEGYLEAYKGYLDSRQSLQKNLARRNELTKTIGSDPVELVRTLDVKEVATASFVVGSSVEKVLLVKMGTRAPKLPEGTDAWPYPGVMSVLFGNMFGLEDESCFTLAGDWAVVGSKAAVAEYVEGKALEYTLKEYMADAGQEDLLARPRTSFVSYFSFSEAEQSLSEIFTKSFMKTFGYFYEGAEYCPAVFSVTHGKKGVVLDASVRKLTLQKTKAPAFERDTVVVVPSGPFEVKNSGTGKMNKFYQNQHLTLCLSEDGKDLWGVPFKNKVCGTAQNVDYYANGKLQIAFGAGSQIYLIDRLGRYVSGFPVDLGKDILIGPDVYDFNGTRKYNIMVLHKDNTVEMYNLKGQKPASWKGIRPSETVKALPERLVVSGSTYWVVRTSIQTLIYPFYGGEPLTVSSGDQMIRPDSEIKPLEGASVDVVCYDGKHRTVKLK